MKIFWRDLRYTSYLYSLWSLYSLVKCPIISVCPLITRFSTVTPTSFHSYQGGCRAFFKYRCVFESYTGIHLYPGNVHFLVFYYSIT